VPTTPAQVFHMLRRQAIRPMRRPLVVMSPKSLLRHKLATSTLEELANGSFQNVIGDNSVEPAKVERVVLCSGKVYYTLLEERTARKQENVALIRLEQLYPFPEAELKLALASFKNVKDIFWCQEEPMNQGAWYSSQHHMRHVVAEVYGKAIHLDYVGRDPSAAPAGGYMSAHIEEEKRFVNKALTV